jgi:transcriptional regulator with XRE-family HTH domain
MAERLGCSQDEIAQSEEPCSNPTVSFLKAWAETLGSRLDIVLTGPDESGGT